MELGDYFTSMAIMVSCGFIAGIVFGVFEYFFIKRSN